MEPFYTVICEFEGGTYVSQVQAIDELHAVTVWVDRFPKEDNAPTCSIVVAKVIRDKIYDGEGPVRLQGLINAWCLTALSGDEMALLNIVKTSKD